MVDGKTDELAKLTATAVYDISDPNNSIMMNTGLLEAIFKDAIILLKNDAGELPHTLGGVPPERIETAVNDLFTGIKEGASKIQSVAEKLKRYT